jgi:hypothetical protein
MQSRETRFVLCIQTGERKGEQFPLVEGTLQVGRRVDCALVLSDGSVSGKHAELRVAAERVELVDLGSTNGTRVAGKRVEQAVLSHGDELHFGNVRALLHDARVAGPAASAAPSVLDREPAVQAQDGGALGKVTADKVRRSGGGSKRLALVLLGVLVLAGGGAFAALRFLATGPAAAKAEPVPAVPGNLVADASFEEGTGEWSSAEAATVALVRDRSFARSGELGLGANLGAGEWTLARSAEFALPARRALVASAALRVEDGARGRFGVELSSANQPLPAFVAWAPALRAAAGFETQELAFDVQGGYDRARLVVAALGAGLVAVDDVAALGAEARGGGARFTEYELVVLGSPGSSAMLVRSGRALLAGIELSAWSRNGLAGWAEARLAVEAGERGFRLGFPGAPADAELRFLALRPDGGGSEGWVATTGDGGYAAHGAEFTRAGAQSLLLGSGTELLRLAFEREVEVRSTSAEGALAIAIALGGLEGCELQLSFVEERAGAATLADRAADEERRGDLGVALATWTELLDRFPFERGLVARATAARSRLVQVGLDQVDELRREIERARFFLLPEIFRKCQARARALAAQYRGSEVEAEAAKTAQVATAALTELEAGDRSGESRRLAGVLEALDPARSPHLAAHVRAALAGDAGGEDE